MDRIHKDAEKILRMLDGEEKIDLSIIDTFISTMQTVDATEVLESGSVAELYSASLGIFSAETEPSEQVFLTALIVQQTLAEKLSMQPFNDGEVSEFRKRLEVLHNHPHMMKVVESFQNSSIYKNVQLFNSVIKKMNEMMTQEFEP